MVEQIICERLNEYLPEVTIVAISHRLASLSWVNRILVLAEGELADTGTHGSLYRKNELYTILYDQKSIVPV